MSKLVQLNLRPTPRVLRQFGFIALGGFGLLALLVWRESGFVAQHAAGARMPLTICFATLALLSAVFSLVAPRANLPVYLGISIVSYPIGFVVSYVIMGVLFFVVFGLFALVMRVLGRDPLNRAYDPATPSYWTEPRGERSSDSYFRQF